MAHRSFPQALSVSHDLGRVGYESEMDKTLFSHACKNNDSDDFKKIYLPPTIFITNLLSKEWKEYNLGFDDLLFLYRLFDNFSI